MTRLPYPQLRDLPVTDASTRAMLAVVTGPSGRGQGRRRAGPAGPGAGRVPLGVHQGRGCSSWIAISPAWPAHREPGQGHARPDPPQERHHGHEDRRLPARRVLPGRCRREDGQDPDAGDRVLREVEGQQVPEMFCLITDLDDWQAYPAGMLAAAYKWRWDGSETALREAKSAIRGAGPSDRADLPVPLPGPDPPGARRLGHRRRTGPRGRPRRRPVRRPGPQGPPRRAARPAPGDLLHRRPPRRDHHHQVRHGHRQPARRAHRGRTAPASSAIWPGAASPSTGTGTATTRPKPGRHSPHAGPRHRHPHGTRPDQRLRPRRRLIARTPSPAPATRSTRRPWNRPPAQNDSRAASTHPRRYHLRRPSRQTHQHAPEARTPSSTWHWARRPR